MERFIPEEWYALFRADTGRLVVRILLIVAAGFLFLRLLMWLIGSLGKKGFSEKIVLIARKGTFYTGLLIILMLVLNQFGIDLTALLGAAGIAGIALGFAAQTSVSNIISGLFLISEDSFSPGDVIKVGSIVGTVLSVDLLSIKVRTFDNQYIRIPNETLIKTELVNVTRFPIRRMEMTVTVGYDTDLAKVKDIFLGAIKEVPNALEDPEPLFLVQKCGPLGVDVLLGVWFAKEEFLSVNNNVKIRILAALRREGITLPTAQAVTT